MKQHILILILCLIVAVCAALGGYFAGKTEVFERILNDKIECSLTINPITMEKLN